MTLDWKHWALTHAVWVVAAAVGGVGVHSWIQEHDNHLIAEQKVAVAEQQVKTLHDQISQNDKAITGLQQQIEANDSRARQQIAQLQTIVAKVKTASQAASAIGNLSDGAVTPKLNTNGDYTIPAPQVVPLFEELAEGKQDAIRLQTCSADLESEKQVVAKTQDNVVAQEKIAAQKQNEIDTLKKPQRFWRRVGSEVKQVGISLGIGFLLGHKF